jgi:hypothetical protein
LGAYRTSGGSRRSAEVAYAVAQTTGEIRYRWDSFVREQHFLDGATKPAKGVRTFTGPSLSGSASEPVVPPAA